MLQFVALLTLIQPVNMALCNTGQSYLTGVFKSYSHTKLERYPLRPITVRPGTINLACYLLTTTADVRHSKEQHHEPIKTENRTACP